MSASADQDTVDERISVDVDDLTTHAFKWHFQLDENEAEESKELLKVYGQLIHRKLQDEATDDPRLAGMGTTITGALSIGTEAFIAHVGDSRAYLLHDGILQQLTRDHTLAQELADAGVLPSVTAAPRRMQNMLVNCLGGSRSEVDVDVQQVHLADGDRLLLCTDGQTGRLHHGYRCAWPRAGAAKGRTQTSDT